MLAKILRPGTFLLALMCFLLPFIRISCNNTVMVEAKGHYMAFGHTKVKKDQDTSQASKTQAQNKVTKEEEEDNSDFKMQPLMLSAFIVLALGLLISLTRLPYARLLQSLLSLAAVVLFVYYFIDYKHQLNIEDKGDTGKNELGKEVKIDVKFLYGYWLCLGFSGLALVSSALPLEKTGAGNQAPPPDSDDVPVPDTIPENSSMGPEPDNDLPENEPEMEQ